MNKDKTNYFESVRTRNESMLKYKQPQRQQFADTRKFTSKGRCINTVNITKDDIDLEEICEFLSFTCLWNGEILDFYTVAAHSVHVASFVRPELRFEALMHDAHEAYKSKGMMNILKDTDLIRGKFGLPAVLSTEVQQANIKVLELERTVFIDGFRDISEHDTVHFISPLELTFNASFKDIVNVEYVKFIEHKKGDKK